MFTYIFDICTSLKNTRMNILFTARTLRSGGSERALINTIKAFSDSRYKITLLFEVKESNTWRSELPNNVEIKELKLDNKLYYAFFPLVNPCKSAIGKKLFEIYKKILNNILGHLHVSWNKRYDIVLKHTIPINIEFDLALDFYGYGNFMTAYIAKNISAKQKATWVHSITLTGINRTNDYFIDYDKIYCVSNATLKAFNNQYPQYQEKTEVLYNFIDVDQIVKSSQLSVNFSFDKNYFTIVTVGRLAYEKGFDIAVLSAKEILNRGYDFRWYFIGWGSEETQLQKMIQENKLQKEVIILGQKDNPMPYIKMANLYVQPSRFEGFGLTVAEALVLKKTVIASDIESFREQIQSGENGYLVPITPESFANCIIDIITGKKPMINRQSKICSTDLATLNKRLTDF